MYIKYLLTWSSNSRASRIFPGMIPRMPPPSMLRMVMRFPFTGVMILLSEGEDSIANSCDQIWYSDTNVYPMMKSRVIELRYLKESYVN